MKRLLALAVFLVALVVFIVSLYLSKEHQGQPHQPLFYMASESQSIYKSNQSALPASFSSPLTATSNTAGSYIAVLDNDLNNDGNYDSLADSLAAMGSLLVVLSAGVLFGAAGGGRLLLALFEPTRLFSYWLEVLEKPG